MQQEASRKLGFTLKKTMSVAQGLYEGVKIPEKRFSWFNYIYENRLNKNLRSSKTGNKRAYSKYLWRAIL